MNPTRQLRGIMERIPLLTVYTMKAKCQPKSSLSSEKSKKSSSDGYRVYGRDGEEEIQELKMIVRYANDIQQ